MNPPAADRRVLVSVPERYVAGTDVRGRQEGRLLIADWRLRIAD